jgi:hypothetical protein
MKVNGLKRKLNLKIKAFKGEYEVFVMKFKIKMQCSICKKWVTPDIVILGKAHVYGIHCGIQQDIGCVFYEEN